MKNYSFILPGGGIFSRLLQFGILPLADIDFDNVLLVPAGFDKPDDPNDEFCRKCYKICLDNVSAMQKYGIEDPYKHVINYVLDQQLDLQYEHRGYLTLGPRYDKENRIENSPRLHDYRKVLSKIRFTSDVHRAHAETLTKHNIGLRTLGVHVRLTSMNLLHHDLYQQISVTDYVREIKRELDTGNYDNVFVASDNNESIIKLRQHFGNLVTFNENFLRYDQEQMHSFDESMIEYEWFYQKRAWIETFADTMGLSSCGGLICRESNLANMAILFGRNLRTITRVYHA